ncbi:hypothetical protein [Microbacterium sp. GCS4]|uniref:hypothetical protein n=1 Tax=Microbacterium sp. GCS4 TaxID=1692239 RepID=UPI000680285D|nr:hypothetical protein [Microbacterium sp. GCS4]KNY06870.1 hypothetical protein AKH00_00570 [Microbacterium sp. GCS4]
MPIVPTPGADAVAAGMDLVPGGGYASDIDEYINQTRDYIAQRTSTVTPVAKGGTGASTAAGARTNLDVNSKQEDADALKTRVVNLSSATNAVQLQWIGGRLRMIIDASNVGDIANTVDVGAKLDAAGGTITGGLVVNGNLVLPFAAPAVSGYTIAYINGDGRVSKGASSERYKKYISKIDPASLGDLFPGLWRFQMRTGDGTWKYGDIAERLAENPATEPFVVYNDQGQAESVDFIGILNARVAQLHQTVEAQRAEIEELHTAVDLISQRLEAVEGR